MKYASVVAKKILDEMREKGLASDNSVFVVQAKLCVSYGQEKRSITLDVFSENIDSSDRDSGVSELSKSIENVLLRLSIDLNNFDWENVSVISSNNSTDGNIIHGKAFINEILG